MNHLSEQEYQEFVDWLNEKRSGTVKAKRKQYSDEGDVLENFRWIADAVGMDELLTFKGTCPHCDGHIEVKKDVDPVSVIITILMLKHTQSIVKSVRNGTFDVKWENPDGSEGNGQKVGDDINYLELLGGRGYELGKESRKSMRRVLSE